MTTPTPTVEQLYRPLCTEATLAWARWDMFKELYANRGRLELLKASAAGFFSLIQDALFDDVLLAISRMTDSPGPGSYANLTLALLSEHLGQAGLTKAQADFEAVLAQLRVDAAARDRGAENYDGRGNLLAPRENIWVRRAPIPRPARTCWSRLLPLPTPSHQLHKLVRIRAYTISWGASRRAIRPSGKCCRRARLLGTPTRNGRRFASEQRSQGTPFCWRPRIRV